MSKFQLVINNDAGDEFEHSPAGHSAFKESLTIPRSVSALDIIVHAELTEQQFVNLVAMLAKSWHHIAMLTARSVPIRAVVNPWERFKVDGIERVLHMFPESGTVEALRVAKIGDSSYVFHVRLFDNRQDKNVVCSVIYRVMNIVEWAEKYGNGVCLTGSKKLKWSTFNEISVHVRRVFEGSAQPRLRRGRVRPPGAQTQAEVEDDDIGESDNYED